MSVLASTQQKGLCLCDEGSALKMEDYPDYSSEPSVITRVLTWERGKQRSQRRCANGSRDWSDAGPRVKECSQLLEAKKGKEMGSPLELPEGAQQNKNLNK